MPVQLILYSIITKDIQKTLKIKDEPWVYNCLLSLGLLFLMYNASLIVVSKSSLPRSRILNLSHEKLSLHLEHIRLMEFATSGMFLYNDRLYKQTDGVTMGSPLGPTLANFVWEF